MDKTYLEINIFSRQNSNDVICVGKILVDNDNGWFEGIEQQEKRFIFGVFLRPKVIQLYSMDTESNINNLKLSREYNVKYEGNTSDNSQIQMVIKSLESDPRDFDEEKEKFKTKLEQFKELFLIGKNKETYMRYYEQREKLSKTMLREYEKNIDISR